MLFLTIAGLVLWIVALLLKVFYIVIVPQGAVVLDYVELGITILAVTILLYDVIGG